MRTSLWFLVLLVLFCLARADTDDASSDVITLDADSFQKTIAETPLIAVEFYSPWCGHCKSLAPEWEKAATELKGKVPVAKVDCTASGEICDQNEVQGYPTLKLFRDGQPTNMEVARKSEAIVSFLTREMSPPMTVVTKAELADWLAKHKTCVVGYLDNDHDDRHSTFKQVALKKRHSIDFAVVIGGGEEHSSPSIALYRDFEEPNQLIYDGEYTAPAIESWISKNLLPTLGEISAETFPAYQAADVAVLGYLFVDPNDASTAPFLKQVEAKLGDFKNDFVVAWIDNNRYASQATRLGLGTKIPSLSLDNHAEGVRYVFPEDQTLTADALAEWFGQYKAGSLTPHVKSEPIPTDNEGPVKVLVANNFKEIVYDTNKDVLVEFYAPWCGHCKNLAPTWEELGTKFAAVDTVVIAKIDATANDVPPKLNIRGFPTIIYFPGNNKESPLEYQGPRSLDDFAQFVKSNAGVSKFPQEEEKANDDAHDHDHEHDHDEL